TPISGYKGAVSGRYPMHRRAAMESSTVSWPLIEREPLVGGRKPVAMRMVVVFPAPLGPARPTTWRRGISHATWGSAGSAPSHLAMPEARIIGERTIGARAGRVRVMAEERVCRWMGYGPGR